MIFGFEINFIIDKNALIIEPSTFSKIMILSLSKFKRLICVSGIFIKIEKTFGRFLQIQFLMKNRRHSEQWIFGHSMI